MGTANLVAFHPDYLFPAMTYLTESKIVSRETISRRVNAWRVRGDVVVFTNGCFDLLHLGHVDYLEKASLLGDRLVIGLNSDSSVAALKGDDRPIMDEHSRARVLAALQFVDGVVIFDEATPLELIKVIEPDVLVKGQDYKPEDVVGKEVVEQRGGSVQTVPLVDGYSTSAIVEKIRA